MADRMPFRCAVVVFCTAEGVDWADANNVAEAAVSLALRQGERGPFPVLSLRHPRLREPIRVQVVRTEASDNAFRGNYFTTPRPTAYSWLMSGFEDPENPAGPSS